MVLLELEKQAQYLHCHVSYLGKIIVLCLVLYQVIKPVNISLDLTISEIGCLNLTRQTSAGSRLSARKSRTLRVKRPGLLTQTHSIRVPRIKLLFWTRPTL